MSTMPQKTRYTPEEYLSLERSAEHKHEFFAGEIFAMAGASKEHVRISGNLYFHLRLQLQGKPCEPFNSDMRIKVATSGLYTYPEVSVACAPLQFEDAQGDTLVNPKVLIEVLSPSTEHHDRHFKFKHYRRLDSVTEILLVHQDSPSVERYFRQPGTDLWIFDPRYGLEETLRLESIDCTLTLAQVYQDVEFPPEEEAK